MALFNCDRRNCIGFALVASLVVGIITAFLQITAVITLTPAFLWVVPGIAVFYLAVLLRARHHDGCGTALGALLIGILGSILVSLILLGITFAATSVAGAIFAGLLLFFFSLTVTSAACYVRCLND